MKDDSPWLLAAYLVVAALVLSFMFLWAFVEDEIVMQQGAEIDHSLNADQADKNRGLLLAPVENRGE